MSDSVMANPVSRRELRSSAAPDPGTLLALTLIQSVGDVEPFRIVPISQRHGTVMGADELMTAKVKWARRAGYSVLTKNVPDTFAPYNVVIRVSEAGTEDHNLDYLARIVG